MTADPAVQLTDILVDHGRFQLDVPHLAFPTGRVTGLVGANGAGKSTLLRLLPGLDVPHRGRVTVLGRDPRRDPVGVRSRLGFMADDMPVFELPIRRLLHHLSGFYPTWDPELVRHLAGRFDLDPDARPSTLSKGQGTRLRLVCAMAFQPEVLVLDEPATGLDLAGRRALLEAVLDVAQDGSRTVILSSHMLADVERIADHLVVLHEGRVARQGDLPELLTPGQTLEEHLLGWGLA